MGEERGSFGSAKMEAQRNSEQSAYLFNQSELAKVCVYKIPEEVTRCIYLLEMERQVKKGRRRSIPAGAE